MRNFKQPLLTIFVIFATAYVLTIVGCAGSSNGNNPSPTAATDPTVVQPSEQDTLQPHDPKDLRECTGDEFASLVSWSTILKSSDEAIKASSGLKNAATVQRALLAINKCDQLEFYHTLKPCKKTKTNRTIVSPKDVKIEVTAYDAFRINERCRQTESYLVKFNLRPDAKQSRPDTIAPVKPPKPVAPVDPTPGQPVEIGQFRKCSTDEFAKLNTWKSSLDLANKNISKLGAQNDWKFDPIILDSASTASKSCETLAAYHQNQPCMREKSYTGETIRQQCVTARTYFYNFAQRTDSLIVSNAKLYLNTSVLKNRTFEPGLETLQMGQCVLTNLTAGSITYSGQKTLVTEARVYTSQLQMFAIVTQEGLKFECYGIEFNSAATSLSEVMKLLSAKDSSLPLSYELN